ncbi:hypothetical protein BLJ79_20510 [Arthrobacter sp. UCD-GKA]|uniref:phosphoribosyltransferase n=1 Tax=Arthrobacter sp. UCD-GKA TaxID=1913576 RepID=UPI0008DD1D22|nr:phosphoribosyltransferase family protein [Arthrobacter sp. UCD-GKA]OIH82302.1 hypothetical protein BLJ79_20510 [Arthrobacter sp. UCD-GKA]
MGRHAAVKFHDRAQAGELLGEVLAAQGLGADTVVLGLLRGGLPVAAPLAHRLGAELGALAVRKLGVPGHEEVAFGAIATYRRVAGRYLVPSVHHHALASAGTAGLRAVEERAPAELEVLAARFADFAPPLAGRTVVLCDDGLATGATMHASLDVVTRCGADQVVVAVPVAPRERAHAMEGASAIVVLHSPRDFSAVGSHYEDFSQVQEETVAALLRGSRNPDA